MTKTLSAPRERDKERSPSTQCKGRLAHSLNCRGREHQHDEKVESDQASPPSTPDSDKISSEVAESDVSSLHPNRAKGQRHWDEQGSQPTALTEQEPAMHPNTTLKDSRVNFRLGTGRLHAKVDYRADSAPKVPPPAPTTVPSLPPLLTNKHY